MPAAHANSGGFSRTGTLHHLARFATVGVAATLLYGVCAAILGAGPFAPSTASLAAYAIAALFSYAGHKFFTFMSAGAHRFEAPRFVALTAFGLALSYVLPAFLTGWLGLPVLVPVLLVCMIVPAANFIILDRWVFGTRHHPRHSGQDNAIGP